MPERKEARDRAQATVDAAAVSVQTLPDMTAGDRSIVVRVSPKTWAALEIIAQAQLGHQVLETFSGSSAYADGPGC